MVNRVMILKRAAILFFITLLIVFAGVFTYYYFPVDIKMEKIEAAPEMETADEQTDANKTYSDGEIKSIAQEWIQNQSPTYKFDGMDLIFVNLERVQDGQCPNCYIAEYNFNSRYAGYGDRKGEMLAQVIVPHSIVLLISNGYVVKAITDGKYDEIQKKLISLNI